MVKSKRLNKIILLLIFAVMIILHMFILSGCSYYISSMVNAGLSLNKIIYTNDYAKYIEGRTVVEEIKTDGYTFTSGAEQGYWILETGKTNVYDVVFTSVQVDYDDNGTIKQGFGSVTGMANSEVYYLMGETGEQVVFDNSHIFSGYNDYYEPGGEYDCIYQDCTGYYDSIDGCMGCTYTYDTWTVDSPKTNEEVYEYTQACTVCHTIVETINDDGTYTYTLEWACNCSGKFWHDGTWQSKTETWLAEGDTPVSFNELVVDGFDFDYIYQYITTFDYDSTYTSWEQYYNPGDYSHMFSDLPVTKITIKNISGMGDRAIDLSSMFENCTNLELIEFGNLFEGCKPTNISRMFYNCPKLRNIDLTTLDTSLATDMSEMFSSQLNHVSLEQRDNIIESYINNTIVPNEPTLNDGTIYTVESFAQKMDKSKEYIYIILSNQFGLTYPITYSELATGMYNMNFVEFCQVAQQNPTQVGMAEGTYSIADIVDYIETTAATYRIDAVYDAYFYAYTDRDSYVNYVINNMLVPLVDEIPQSSEPYTLESLAQALGTTKEQTLFDIIDNTGLEIPVTYDEFCVVKMNMTLDEFVTFVNNDPTQIGLTPKQDGTDYTAQELVVLLDSEIKSTGYIVLDQEQLSKYYSKYTPNGTLTLGGDNSKFVIKSDTDVSNIFGNICTFGTVVTPNEIGEGIVLVLADTYTHNDVDIVTTITSADATKTFVYVDTNSGDEPEPDTNPEPDTGTNPTQSPKSNNNLTTIIIASASTVVVVGATGIVAYRVIKKKKKL